MFWRLKKCQTLAKLGLSYQTDTLRGGIKIENRVNLGQCPNFNLGILRTEGGGYLFFKNVWIKNRP